MEAVILLSIAVKDILFKTRTASSEFFRYLRLAADAITALELHTVSFPRQRKIEMPESGIIRFPSDMISFTSIGVAKNGRLWTYTHAYDMIMTTKTVDGVRVPDEVIQVGGDKYGAAVRGGRNTHYVSVDYRSRLIFVMGFPKQDVYLTYTSSGVDTDRPTFIPIELIPAITAYIKWEEVKYDPEVPYRTKIINEQYFHQQRRLLESLRWPTAEQWADIIRKTYSRGVIR